MSQIRRSARALLLDETHRVLLIRYAVVRSESEVVFWATPGGAVEEGETDQQAARREIAEELGLDTFLTGPVHSQFDRFEHMGVQVENTDVFFLGHCAAKAPKLSGTTPEERNAMKTLRWWTIGEIKGSSETIFPPDLALVLERL